MVYALLKLMDSFNMLNNNKIKSLLLSGLLLGMGSSVVSATPGTHFSIGVAGQHYLYREPGLMKDNGWLAGINADFVYGFKNPFFIALETRILGGKAHYSSNGTGKMKNVTQFIFEMRPLFGHNFQISSTTTLSPYTGLGYRYKSDYSDRRRTTTGHVGYDRISQYLYLPLGLKTNHTLNQEWDLTTRGEFDLLLVGRQESKFKGIGSIHHRQNTGHGFKAEVNFVKKLCNKKSAISFGPYFHYWHIKDSNIVHGTMEPRNKTYETGLAVKYHF
jgi:hypothetical protein